MILSAVEMLLLVERESLRASGMLVDPVPSHVFETLRQDLIEAALDAQEGNVSGLTACLAQCPGYLQLEVGKFRVYVPWHLVDAFPSLLVLNNLLNIGEKIAVDAGSGFCISGSAVWSGLNIEVGDLDFSQYTDNYGASMCELIERLREPTSDRVLLKASYGKSCKDKLPWQEWENILRALGACASLKTSKRVMLDYAVRTKAFGTLPASTAVFLSDFVDRQNSAAKESFIFQEIVCAPIANNKPPWTLVDPEQIGAYLFFLFSQIGQYRHEKPIKAVKRALSLSYLLSLDESINQAVAILESNETSIAVRLKRQAEVAEIAELLRTHGVHSWEDCGTEDAVPDAADRLEDLAGIFNSFFHSLGENLRNEDAGGRWPTF